MPHLNIPYIASFTIDYLWMSTISAVVYLLAADDRFSILTATSAILYVVAVNPIREYVYWYLFRNHESFSHFKTESRTTDVKGFWWDTVQTTATHALLIIVASHLNMLHCNFESTPGGIWESLIIVSKDFWAFKIIKDNTSMRFLHPWMHRRENYWIHKRHHEGNRNTNYMHAMVFSTLDLFIEFGLGIVLTLLCKYLIFGGTPSLHLLAIAFASWTAGNVHSLNPYTQALGNPILDYIFKLTIAHNLHHACQLDPKYMCDIPLHHLNPSDRAADIARYNKIMETKVDFRVFLD